jgi:hypothetical protein
VSGCSTAAPSSTISTRLSCPLDSWCHQASLCDGPCCVSTRLRPGLRKNSTSVVTNSPDATRQSAILQLSRGWSVRLTRRCLGLKASRRHHLLVAGFQPGQIPFGSHRPPEQHDSVRRFRDGLHRSLVQRAGTGLKRVYGAGARAGRPCDRLVLHRGGGPPRVRAEIEIVQRAPPAPRRSYGILRLIPTTHHRPPASSCSTLASAWLNTTCSSALWRPSGCARSDAALPAASARTPSNAGASARRRGARRVAVRDCRSCLAYRR